MGSGTLSNTVVREDSPSLLHSHKLELREKPSGIFSMFTRYDFPLLPASVQAM